MKTITALYVANAKAFLRDRTAGFLVLLLPVALAAFFGLVFSGGGAYAPQLGVVDEDGGPGAQRLLAVLEAADADEALVLHHGARADMQELLHRGELSLVIVLPDRLSAAIEAGEPGTIEAWYDPAQPSSAGVGLGLVRTLVSEASLALSDAPRRLVMEERAVTTHPLRAVDLQLPGMLGIALLWLGLFGTALPLVQERETKALRRLSVTPLRPTALVTAQVAWRMTIALLQAALFLLVGYAGFGVRVQGSWLLLASAVTLGALLFITLGTFLAALAPTTEAVSAIVQIVNMPMMLLSGSLMTAESLPSFFQPLVAAMPLTYLSDALRQIIVAAPPLHPLGLDFAVMGVWLVALFALSVWLWRWE